MSPGGQMRRCEHLSDSDNCQSITDDRISETTGTAGCPQVQKISEMNQNFAPDLLTVSSNSQLLAPTGWNVTLTTN